MRRRFLVSIAAVGVLASAVVLAQNGGRGTAAPAQSITFADTIAPIVYANCVTCHRPGEAAPFSLISYEDVAKRGALVARVTESRYMPPWHAADGHGEFVGERRLTAKQIADIAAWVKQGMPRGDLARMPRVPEFPPDGWRLGQPDLVLEMPAGFEIPASGPDVFRNFVLPTNLVEDKWVRGVEFRPSARKVVHHALFASVPGGSLAALDGADGRPGFGGMGTVGVGGGQDRRGLGGWAVGGSPTLFPDGIAAPLPRGSDFLLQMHFHPTGKVETEKSQIGIYFADKAPEKAVFSVEIPALFGFGAGIDIPAGEKQFTIQDSFTLPANVRIYSAIAHAHYLATQMKATATLPDGSMRPLIWIDDWDFNWQDSYIYKEPFTLPAGTRIDVVITYDNSADNPRNPINPPRRARWGEQSSDEMGTVGFMFEALDRADAPAFQQALALRNKTAIAAAGKDGTLGRFLARAKRERGGRQQITVYDRTGTVVARVGEPGFYSQAAFSPDGSRIAVIRNDADSDGQDVWMFDLATGRGTAVTADDNADSSPVWSPDGKQIAYTSVRANTAGVYRRNVDGSGSEEKLYEHDSSNLLMLTDWSPDGQLLTYWFGDNNMFLLPVRPGGQPIQMESGRGGRFSPDGRFFAYNGNAGIAGRFNVYVRPLDTAAVAKSGTLPQAEATQISPENAIGGIVWRRDGRELLYLSQPPGQSYMATEITTGSRVSAQAARKLFAIPPGIGGPAQLSSAGAADGERFVFAANLPQRTPAR